MIRKSSFSPAWLLGAALVSASAVASDTSSMPTGRVDQSEFAVAYQITPAHSGAMVFKAGFKVPLRKVWTASISASEITYALIANDKVFVDAAANGAGNGTDALSLTSGALLWNYDSGASYTGPAYDNGAVFALSRDGLLQAISAQSGALKWSLNAGGDGTSPPTAANGLIYVNSGAIAVDETTGNIVWYGDPVNASTSGAVAYGDSGIYVPGTCFYDKLSALHGITLWQYQSCQDYGVNLDSSVYRTGRVYIEDDFKGNFILASGTGDYLGTFGCDYERPADPPAFFEYEGKQYGVCLSKGTLHAWNATTGNDLWSFVGDGRLSTPPIVVNGYVFAGSSLGHIYALAVANGRKKWLERIDSAPTSFAAGEGRLIVVSSGSVTAYAPR
ncbi:MAG TPA: PQQ-binding-like beta-propeller repeat protein [Rhizomicrobium sp.]|nr:PQQ-binding-like beta-propeller repeat protein [Rhizomicrobium sp.]